MLSEAGVYVAAKMMQKKKKKTCKTETTWKTTGLQVDASYVANL